MSTYCDLHTHSIFSDGTFTPEEIIKEAERIGLSAVALCDHNTAEGLPAFLQAGETSSVRTVPGAELTTTWRGKELHILGLFLPEESLATLQAYTEEYLLQKEESTFEMVCRLAKDGYRLDYVAMQEATPKGRLNRAHVAAALAEKGYVSSIKEAFATLLHEDGGYYVPTERPGALRTIAFLKSIGAVPVLAHPLLDLGREELKEFLPQAVEAGLAAVEVLHPAHGREEEAFVFALIEKYNLLSSGGSDFHGTRKPDVTLGMKNVPHTYFESLLNCSTHRA